jgi:hypothetical protein
MSKVSRHQDASRIMRYNAVKNDKMNIQGQDIVERSTVTVVVEEPGTLLA